MSCHSVSREEHSLTFARNYCRTTADTRSFVVRIHLRFRASSFIDLKLIVLFVPSPIFFSLTHKLLLLSNSSLSLFVRSTLDLFLSSRSLYLFFDASYQLTVQVTCLSLLNCLLSFFLCPLSLMTTNSARNDLKRSPNIFFLS